jgi:carbonic anhydrase/acetyltransferase-like protein (isoleucine patch superfamily)
MLIYYYFPQSIVMHDVVIRGDYCNISINRYCFIDEATRLRPAHMPLSSPESLKNSSESDNTATTTDTCMNDLEERNPHATYIPMHIGKYTHIGKRCDIQAASIGLGCNIGNQCVISNRAILKDHVRVEDGTVVPADFVAPPFVILAGMNVFRCVRDILV